MTPAVSLELAALPCIAARSSVVSGGLVGPRLRLVAAPRAVRHELVELGLILGPSQVFEELGELPLVILEAAQGLLAIVVEGAVAGRARRPAAAAPPAEAAKLLDAAVMPVAH